MSPTNRRHRPSRLSHHRRRALRMHQTEIILTRKPRAQGVSLARKTPSTPTYTQGNVPFK